MPKTGDEDFVPWGGSIGCGYCGTEFQVRVPVLDENQQPVWDWYMDEYQQIFALDDVASGQLLAEHVEEEHPIITDGRGGIVLTEYGNPKRANVTTNVQY